MITRNNLLLVALEDNDHDLRMEIAVELVSQDSWPVSMLTNFLDTIKKRAPLKALGIYTELVEKVPKIGEISELTTWLESTLNVLESR